MMGPLHEQSVTVYDNVPMAKDNKLFIDSFSSFRQDEVFFLYFLCCRVSIQCSFGNHLDSNSWSTVTTTPAPTKSPFKLDFVIHIIE